MLKAAGLAAVSLTGLGAAGGAVAADYRTVTVPAGENRRFSVGSGETFENVLIDVTASGADAHIDASGDNWTIRNVGFRGAIDVERYSNAIKARGNGTIENVYLGDGHVDGVDRGAIGVPADHAGHIDVRNTYVARYANNAVYAAGPARVRGPGKTDGAGGSVGFTNCYFRDNNISHLRIAADGSFVRDSVIHNTNDVPPIPTSAGGASNVVNSRGVYTGYGDPSQVVTVENCDIRVTDGNTNGGASAVVSGHHGTYGDCSTVRVVDSRVEGALVGGMVETRNVGSSPTVAVPSGVPTDARAAASGGGSSGGGSGDPPADDPSLPDTVTIAGGSASEFVRYSFEVSDAVEKSTANGATVSGEDTVSGQSVTGYVAGGVDSYAFAGEFVAFEMDGDATVTVNGERVDPASLAPDPELPHRLRVTGGRAGDPVEYEFSVSGDLAADEAADAEDSISGSTATGVVAGGSDGYRFGGDLTDLSVDGNAMVFVDGEQVDPSSVGDQPDYSRTITITGGTALTELQYSFTASGGVEPAGGDAAVDAEDSISGNTVEGVVAGGSDGYRFGGEITAFETSGGDAGLAVVVDGDMVDPSTLG